MGKPDPSKLPTNIPFSKQETTLNFKVLIHCEGCKRKVKRIIKCVDGVNSVNIEPEYGKVMVVGSGVDANAVLHSLHKAGKHAEVWQMGGGKLPSANQPSSGGGGGGGGGGNNNNNNNNKQPNNNNKSNNNNANNKLLEGNNNINPKGKGAEGNNPGGVSNNLGGKLKGGEMVELADFGPPPNLTFPNGGFTPGGGGQFEKPTSNNVAILSKSVAPRPTIYNGETSYSFLERSENASADYATHLFSDENANNCSIM